MGMHLSLNMCPYWEGIVGEIRLFLLTSGTHIWSSPCGFGGGSRSLFPNTSNRRGGTESSFHGFHVAWASKDCFLIKRATELGQLESFLLYFQCMMAASVGWTPDLLGTSVHDSVKTSMRMDDIAGRQKTRRNLVLAGCVCPLHSESTQEAFTQSNVRLSRKNLQEL